MVDTGQGLVGTNMFAYCENNPVNYGDPTGMARGPVSGATVVAYWNSRGYSWFLTDTYDHFKNSRGHVISVPIPKAAPVPKKTTNRGTGNGSSANQNSLPKLRDVTGEINKALKTEGVADFHRSLVAASSHSNKKAVQAALYMEFYSLVKDKAKWDIKRKESWNDTIGTAHPGKGIIVLYSGKMMTPEALGNYTYGYLGAMFGFSPQMVGLGSAYAAEFPLWGSEFQNERLDQMYVGMGYSAYFK